MSKQREMFSPEERRKRARRVKNDIVCGAKLPPALKAVLVVLWEFCGGNRFCWPSQQAIAERVGYAWPESRRALQLKLRELERRRIIISEEGIRADGSQTSNKYRILWGNLKRTANVTARSVQGALKQARGGRLLERGGALKQARGGAYLSAGGALKQAPLEPVLNPIEPTPTPKLNTRPSNPSTGGDGGGRLFEKTQNSKTLSPPPVRKRGEWARRIYREDLPKNWKMFEVFQRTVDAGVLQDDPAGLSRLRFLSVIRTAQQRTDLSNLTGWIVDMIEDRTWGYISPQVVPKVYAVLNPTDPEMPPEMLERVLNSKF